MKRFTYVTAQRGLTIIEVLIGAVVFVIGFSILVAMMSNVSSRFSIRELNLADQLGHECMLRSVTLADTTFTDTVVTRSDIALSVRKEVTVDDGLASVQVTVTRKKTGRELLRLYDEFALVEKP